MNVPQQLFSKQQWSRLNELIIELDESQSLWLSGYLAASAHHQEVFLDTPGKTSNKVLISFGTETGNCRQLATKLAELCHTNGIEAEIKDLAGVQLRRLKKCEYLIIITATHGDGAPPEPITNFYEEILAEDAPDLKGLKYAVLALGDSSYENFCVTGISLDQRLEELGGERLIARQDCDVNFEIPANQWIAKLLKLLPQTDKQVNRNIRTITPKIEFNKDHPIITEVLTNQKLSQENRDIPIHHLELALNHVNFPIVPGDAVGILADNPPELVAMVLDATGLSGEHPVTLGGQAQSLVEVLRRHRDLTIPGKTFLELWAGLTGSDELTAVINEDNKKQRLFLREHQVRDLILNFPARPEAQVLVDALRPLQPRLYDIANCLSVIEDELHLTVKAFSYDFGGRHETGIASRYLLELQPGDSVQFYPHSNVRFRLPQQLNTPLILVAEGTGIAPYRAFLQSLSKMNSSPPCWLIFAEENFEEDFLYQLDLQEAHEASVLTHFDTVFYQSNPGVSLADPILIHSERLLRWLNDGAHIYFCGEKASLETCESTLLAHLEERQRKTQWKKLVKEKRVHRNLY